MSHLDGTSDELVRQAIADLTMARVCEEPILPVMVESIERLAEVIRRQQAQIAALEAARAPHGLPLEGTGPLPLERKGE